MSFLYTVLAFFIVFGIIVLVHEFGHFIAARLMGVRVEVFSFGFGKRLWGKKVGDTDYRFSLVPLGGFVKMSGEEEYDSEDLKPYEFHAKNRAQRMFILVMGAVMNIVLAFVIFTVINLSGVQVAKYRLEPPLINYIIEGSPAANAGIKPGDLILTVGGTKIETWKSLEMNIGNSPNEDLVIEFQREGEKKSARLKVGATKQYGIGDAGFYHGFHTKIRALLKNYPAEKAGLKVDDVITAINGKTVFFHEFATIIDENGEKPLQIQVKRGEEELSVTVAPVEEEEEEGKRFVLGLNHSADFPTMEFNYGLWSAMEKSGKDMIEMTGFIFTAFRKMIKGKISPKNLSGPIEIAKFSERAMKSGPSNLFMLIAFISLQLGLVNLFPIPVLDGGHLLILSVETIIRKDLSARIKIILMNTGLVLLVSLMGFVILNDVAKLLPNGWGSFWPF